ncbi:MAG: hypothetical protein ACOYMB_05110, partial [Patescibacteria group bacterium]
MFFALIISIVYVNDLFLMKQLLSHNQNSFFRISGGETKLAFYFLVIKLLYNISVFWAIVSQ